MWVERQQVTDATLPPDASCAHLQVQRSLSLSLVLNWLPAWERLLVRPAVPLKPSAWRLERKKKNEYRNSAKKLSCRRSYSLFKAMLGNLLAAANDSEWKLPPNWLKLSISKVIQSCSAKLNTAQLCLLTRLVCISIIPQDTNRMRLTNWLLTVHFSFVELWFFTASGNIWLYNLVLVNRFLKRAQSDVPLFHRSFFLLRNSVRGGVFLDESLSSSSLNSNKICQFIILQR